MKTDNLIRKLKTFSRPRLKKKKKKISSRFSVVILKMNKFILFDFRDDFNIVAFVTLI